MEDRCRVLVLNERDPHHPAAGGAEIHVAEIFSRLAARGFEVTLAASGFRGGASEDEIDGMRVQRLGPLPIYYPRVAWTCARDTRRGRYDVVVECLNKVPFYSPVYSAVPVLGILHHLFGEVAFQQVPWPVAAVVWASELLIPSLYSKQLFVSISESSRDDLVRRGIDYEHVRVSHCGVDAPGVEVELETPRARRVTYVGRLEPYKHVEVLLHAMDRLKDRYPDAEIDIIGRGSARSDLEALTRKLGLENRTHFAGFVSEEERNQLLADSRVCLCPSDKEGWGLTVIESNVVGTPVIASDAPGLRDSVRHDETGFLVETGDVEGFAQRIDELFSDDTRALDMSRAALAWSKHFNWDRAADEMAQALTDARRAS